MRDRRDKRRSDRQTNKTQTAISSKLMTGKRRRQELGTIGRMIMRREQAIVMDVDGIFIKRIFKIIAYSSFP